MVQLFPHQSAAIQRTQEFNRVAYYHDMGLGKTYTGAEKMLQIGENTNLLICQKSKIDDWITHFNTVCHITAFNLTNKKQYDEFFATVGMCIGVINYELAWRRKELKQLTNFTLMLDESSLIQNDKAKQSKFIMSLNPKNIILLSGTPVAGKYENLWTQARLLGWEISKKLYDSQYINWETIDVGGVKHKIVDRKKPYKNIERLRGKLREYGADFLKTEDCFDLPSQIFTRVTIPRSKEYKTFERKHIVDVNGVTLIGDTEFTDRLSKRQLCGVYSSEKLSAFVDLVLSTNDRLIVFYNFNAELYELRTLANELKRPYGVINGSEKNLTAYENEDNSITFVQYQAGAMGLNLHKANKIIYFTLPDGRSDLFEQSKKRIHRIGQEKPCFYWFLTVEKSIEEEIERTLNIRRDYTEKLF